MTSPRLFTSRFLVLMGAQLSFGYAFSGFFLLPKFLAGELDVGPAVIGRVMGAYGFTNVLSTLLMGVLVDRYGRRIFMRTGAVLLLAASLPFAWVDSVGPLIYALRALQGVAVSMVFVAGTTLAVDHAPPARLGEALGFFGLTMLTMNAASPALVEWLSLRVGWSLAFVAVSAGAAVCLALSVWVREGRAPASPDGRAPGLREVALRPRQLRIQAIIALAGTAFGALFTFHQPFAMELGVSRVTTFFAAYVAAAVTVRLGVGRFIDRVGRLAVATGALCLYAGASAAMVFLQELGLVAVGALFGLAHGLFYPAFNAVAVEGTRQDERGKVMALFNGFFNLGFAAGAFALGFVAEAYGYPQVFAVTCVATLGALVLLVTAPNDPERGFSRHPFVA
ncbi:MAG: MFS transporter [Proteobacteria bacterium]|nr:MFS transporter [Pseudomonadota bacterium]